MKRLLIILLVLLQLASLVHADAAASDYDNHWAKQDIVRLQNLSVLNGYPDGTFKPFNPITKAEYIKATVLIMDYTLIDGVSFADIKPFETSQAHWSSVYVETALRNGIISKNAGDENFYPEAGLNRADGAVIIAKALKFEPSTNKSPFADIKEANGYLTKLYEEFIIKGVTENGLTCYNPEALLTRGEAAAYLVRLLDYKTDAEAYKTKVFAELQAARQRELQMKVNEKGVPVRLYSNMTNLTDKTITELSEQRKKAYSYRPDYIPHYLMPEIETFGGTEAFIKYQVDQVRTYMKYTFNVDYNSIEASSYTNNLNNSLGVVTEWYGKVNVDEFKKYKVVSQSEFLTDYDLVFQGPVWGDSVRGTLRIKFDAPTDPEYIKNRIGCELEIGKWYEIDMDIPLARQSVEKTWCVEKNYKFYPIAEPIKIE